MADRVYPAAKPAPPPAMANGGASAPGVPKPPQTYQRPIYRPQGGPAKSRRGRSCRCSFCCCFCWALLVIVLLALVAAAAGGAFYLLYRPQRPTFTVSSVRLTAFNLSATAASPLLTDSIQLTVTAKNPNKKLVYLYDDFSFSAATAANAVPLGSGVVPGFAHKAGNTTVFTATVAADAVAVDPSGAGSDLKTKSGAFSVSVDADTHAGVKVGSLKTKKMAIQVRCVGIKVTPPSPPPKNAKGGKNGTALLAPAPAPAPAALLDVPETTATVSTSPHSCTVRVRVKIGRWTF